MSTTYHLACVTCKEYIWIGQNTHQITDHTGEAFWYLYTAESATMKVFHEFLRRHQSTSVWQHPDDPPPYEYPEHVLAFIDDQLDLDGYAEIDKDGRHEWED